MQHSKIISGIDIGSSKVTTIIGQHFENEDRINVVAVSSIPATGFRKGQIVNIEQATNTIIQSIESAERMAGFQINNAFVTIAASHIESVNSKGVVTIDQKGEIKTEDVERAIQSAQAVTLPGGKEILHVIPRKYNVDGQDGVLDPIGMNGTRLEVETNIILVSSPAIKNLKKCLDEIGVKVDGFIYSGLVTARAVLTETEKELGVVLVDIGGSTTNIIVFNEGRPVYSAVIPIGGNNVTNDLAIGMRFSIEDAERVKIKIGKLMESKKFESEVDISLLGIDSGENRKISLQTAVSGIIRPRLEEIFSMVSDQLANSGFINLIPSGIVLTGGGSLTVNVNDICNEIMSLPLRIAYPPKVGGIIDEIMNPAYTSSIGLLFYSLDNRHKKEQASDRNRMSLNGIFGKIRGFLEPLLP